MAIPPELLPVIQITLPVVLTIFVAVFAQNKRIDDLRADMNRGFDAVTKRLDQIDGTLKQHGERIAKLEERIPPLVHRN